MLKGRLDNEETQVSYIYNKQKNVKKKLVYRVENVVSVYGL
jgi:hypothetical protein